MNAFFSAPRLRFLVPALMLASAAQGQYSITNISNQGSLFSSRRLQELVSPAGNGIGYRAGSGGVFRHGGPATSSFTVTGSGVPYDAYSTTPGNPGVDYFDGFDAAGSAVEIAGSTAPVFGILHFSNGAGNPVTVSNTGGIRVGSELHLSSGVVSTNRAAAGIAGIQLGTTATLTASAPGDGQYINGYVSKAGNSAFTFPVGDQSGTDMRTLSVSGLTSATDTIAVAYWKGDPGTALDPTGGAHSRASISSAGTTGSTRIMSVSPLGFWDWVPVSGTDAATITVSLPDFSVQGGYVSPARMRLVGWNTAAGHWENLSGNAGTNSNAEGTTISGTMSDISAYSAIAVGSVTGLPLPLQLTQFDAVPSGSCGAELSWSTASINGINAFVPQRSSDGVRYTDLESQSWTGAGSYRVRLTNQPGGSVSYRLKAHYADGSFEYSNSLRVKLDCESTEIRLTPNPTSDVVRVTGLPQGGVIRVFDGVGQVLQSLAASGNELKLSLEAYPAGIYILEATRSDGANPERFRIIKR